VCLFLTFVLATIYSYLPIFRSTKLSNTVSRGDPFHPSMATFNSSKSENVSGTFFHLKSVRLEVGIDLKEMISIFRNVKACRLVMNVQSVL